MREVFYKYSNRGMYVTEDNTSFGEDTQLKIVVEPHEFSLELSGEVIRNTSFAGGSVTVSNKGEAGFYNNEGALIAKADEGEGNYRKVLLDWKQDSLCVKFGRMVEVDNYPNCDGEHDRWSEKWETERLVTLSLKDNSIEIK